VNRRGARFDMLPLTKSYSIHEAENVSDSVIKTQSRLRDYFVRLVQQSGGPDFWDTSYNWAYFAKVGEDLENMLSVLDWTWEHKDWTNILVLARGVIHLLHARGRLEERILRARQALHAAKQVGAVEDLVWYYVDGLGYVELQRGDYKAAQRSFSTGLTIAESSGNVAGIALAQSRLALLGIATQEDEETRRWIMAALSRISQTEGRVRTSIHHTAGHWFRLQKQYAQAERHYREAFLLQRDIGLDVASSLYYRLLGLIRYDQCQYKEAEEAFKRCLDLEQQIHNALNIANAKYGLALVAEAEGDNDKATAFVLDAVDVYSRFGAKKELDDAEMLLKRLQCVR